MVAVTGVLAVTGCVAFRLGPLPRAPRLKKAANATAGNASFQFSWRRSPISFRGGRPSEESFRVLPEVLQESGFFSQVRAGGPVEGAVHFDIFLLSDYQEDPTNSQFA